MTTPAGSEPLSQLLARVGLQVPKILLPRPDTDLHRWAVVACDQYTSQLDYWRDVERLVGGHPSTLNLILPEVYLGGDDTPVRVRRINDAMDAYLNDGVLVEQPPSFVLLRRRTHEGRTRRGLVVALDLDLYDFRVGSMSLIRATEGTILERLPPRMEIRRHAPIELPHIMVLIDDPGMSVIEPLFEERLPAVYDFELMKNGGHLEGFRVEDSDTIRRLAEALAALATPAKMQDKYGTRDRGVFLYAMGDGNHSLATAKSIWGELRAAGAPADHPARFALVELVNVHDPGLVFEPIHRVLFGVEAETMLDKITKTARGKGMTCARRVASGLIRQTLADADASGAQVVPFVHAEGDGVLEFGAPVHTLAVGTLQTLLDEILGTGHAGIDFIHGDDVVTELGRKPGNLGFYLPPIPKKDLFRTVVVDGVLPRKAFSMGEADEKRFYVEARRISAG